MELARHFNLFFRIVWVESLRYVHYPLEFISAILNRFMSTIVVALFWYIISTYSDGDLDARYLMSYYLVVGGLIQFSYSNMVFGQGMLRKIKFGRINSSLMRPINTIYLEYAKQTGFVSHFFVLSIFLIIGGSLLNGQAINPFIVAFAVVNMFLINTALNIFLACLGFYLVETQGVKNAYAHTVRILQGNLMPIYLMPMVVQQVLSVTPFPSSLYLPTIAILGQPVPLWQLCLGFVWGVVMMIAANKFWKYSLRRYEAIGE